MEEKQELKVEEGIQIVSWLHIYSYSRKRSFIDAMLAAA